jgi:tetratricopeptide (TPR) repeat protein
MDALANLGATVRALSETFDEAGPMEGRSSQKGHRFQRAADLRPGPETPMDKDAPVETPGDESEEASAAASLSRTAPPGRPLTRRTRGADRVAALRQHPFLVWLVVQAFCFGLILLGVFLGETESGPSKARTVAATHENAPAQSPSRAVPTPAGEASDETGERALRTAGLALVKEETGDLSSARTLLESLADSPKVLPGTEYQLALLALRRGDRPGAGLYLERSLVASEAVAPCCYLRGALAGFQGNYREASDQLRLAVQAEPFNGRYLFYWGESLRRCGKLQDAAAAIRQALARPLTAEEWELYSFKLRLAQVEAGRGDPFDAELEEKLSQPSPSGDWLLLAAAQNVKRHALPAAAEFLQRAARLLPPQTYRTWVSDFAFQNYANEQEIAPFLRVPPPAPAIVAGTPAPDASPRSSPEAGGASDVIAPIAPPLAPPGQATPPPAVPPDPTVCSPAVADPALWRTISPPA